MKSFWYYVLFYMILTVCIVAIASCGKDDDNASDVDLKSYIVGSWHSYRMTAYGNGQEVSADITKNNEYSVSYLEMNFSSDNRVAISGWDVNEDGTSKWITEYGTYSIEGNVVHVRESVFSTDTEWNDEMEFKSSFSRLTRSGNDDEVISFVFEPSMMSLYVRYTMVVNGVNVVGYLYFRK